MKLNQLKIMNKTTTESDTDTFGDDYGAYVIIALFISIVACITLRFKYNFTKEDPERARHNRVFRGTYQNPDSESI